MSDETTQVDKAQAQGTFDVLSFVEDTAYPTAKVVVFQDVKSVAELVQANKDRLDAEVGAEKFDPTEWDEKIAILSDKVRKSSIIFELRGMPPGIVRELYNNAEGEDDAALTAREDELIASTIISASNHEGVKDGRLWKGEDVSKLRRFLNEGEFGKLVQGVADVNFNAAVFDQATDAGFLSRSADVAE